MAGGMVAMVVGGDDPLVLTGMIRVIAGLFRRIASVRLRRPWGGNKGGSTRGGDKGYSAR
jgi:hypothetical protein